MPRTAVTANGNVHPDCQFVSCVYTKEKGKKGKRGDKGKAYLPAA